MSAGDDIRCPMCHTAGWPSVIHLDAYAATCGTHWGAHSETRQSEACRIIAMLRFEVALLQTEAAA